MSLLAFKWAGDQRPRSPIDKLVLLALASRDNATRGDRCVWPSVLWIAAYTGLGQTSIKQSLGRLTAAGLIVDTGQRRGQTGRTKVYRLCFDEPNAGGEKDHETLHFVTANKSSRARNGSGGISFNGTSRDPRTKNFKQGRNLGRRRADHSSMPLSDDDWFAATVLDEIVNPMVRSGIRRERERQNGKCSDGAKDLILVRNVITYEK